MEDAATVDVGDAVGDSVADWKHEQLASVAKIEDPRPLS